MAELFHQHQLANGLMLIGEEMPFVHSAAAGFLVRAGARDESPVLAGVSHFLEHMAFKGTQRRSAWDVNREFDEIGAENNAYTSEERTVFYGAAPAEYLPRILDLLSDMMRPTLSQEEFALEKEVVLEEIARAQDNPSYLVYHQAMERLFAGHPLANDVLGSAPSIRALTAEQMAAYHRQRYQPGNMLLAVAGRFQWPEVVDQAETLCSHWAPGDTPRQAAPPQPHADLAVLHRPTLTREHLAIACLSADDRHPKRYAAGLFGTILGDATGSRLYWAVEQTGLADSVLASRETFEGAGTLVIYASTDPERAAQALAAVEAELEKISAGVTPAELRRAQNKLSSQLVMASENSLNRLLMLGDTYLSRQRYESVDDQLAAIEAVTLDDLATYLAEFPLTPRVTVALGPLEGLE
ncbi:MAG: insulinase family protein [Deinococcus sp.]|nr:insulinase family protein [Deinococcus sp.]